MTTRGIGVRGDTFMVCCDETYYRGLVKPEPAANISLVWHILLERIKIWVDFYGGPAAWSELEPFIFKAQELGRTVQAAFPDMVEMADQVLGWVLAHPLATLGIVVAGVVVTAAVAALAEPLLLAGTVVAASEAAITTEAAATFGATVGAGEASGLGAITTIEQVAAQLVGREAAKRTGVRVTADALARLRALGEAANDVERVQKAAAAVLAPSNIARQLIDPQQGGEASKRHEMLLADALNGPRIAAAAKKVAKQFRGAQLMAASVVSVYEAGAVAGGDAPKAGPFAQGLSRLYFVRPMMPPSNSMRPPQKGREINLRHFALMSEEDLLAAPFDRTPINAYYLGKVTVT
jgi:hypothetical protein